MTEEQAKSIAVEVDDLIAARVSEALAKQDARDSGDTGCWSYATTNNLVKALMDGANNDEDSGHS